MEELPKRALLTITEVASYFYVSERTIYLWIDHGLLEAEKYRRVIRIPKKSVLNFRLKHRIDPDEKYSM